MLSGNSGEDLFGSQSAPIGEQDGNASAEVNAEDVSGSPAASPKGSADALAQPPQTTNSNDAFISQNDAEDDIYASGPADTPQKVSALVEWEATRNKEISEKDEEEQKQIQDIRDKANADLNNFHKKLEENQEKRAKHNADVDDETKANLLSHPSNKWEGVVNYIDFNRSEFHTKDVSRMKGLLLQLKH